jgi:uncharacterized protein with PIN domain
MAPRKNTALAVKPGKQKVIITTLKNLYSRGKYRHKLFVDLAKVSTQKNTGRIKMSNVFIECASCGEITHRESDWVVSKPVPLKPFKVEHLECPKCGSQNIFRDIENTYDSLEDINL